MSRACVVGLALFVLVACDDEKKKEADLLAKVGVEAGAPTASITGVNVLPPPPTSATATTAAAKPPKDCGTGDPVTVDDPDLDAELRLKLNKPQGPLGAADLATVKSVNLTKKPRLDAIDPCVFPKLTGLKFLYLPQGDYYDLSPIANLVKIEGLRVAHSSVEDLKPLAKLTMLDQLDLGVTHVRDLGPLGANNVNITELSLDDTQVSDIGPLAKLTKLEKLSIKNTPVTDVSPLAKLTHLKHLDVSGTALANLETLAPLRARGLVITSK